MHPSRRAYRKRKVKNINSMMRNLKNTNVFHANRFNTGEGNLRCEWPVSLTHFFQNLWFTPLCSVFEWLTFFFFFARMNLWAFAVFREYEDAVSSPFFLFLNSPLTLPWNRENALKYFAKVVTESSNLIPSVMSPPPFLLLLNFFFCSSSF